jgi:hypothetical protein
VYKNVFPQTVIALIPLDVPIDIFSSQYSFNSLSKFINLSNSFLELRKLKNLFAEFNLEPLKPYLLAWFLQ